MGGAKGIGRGLLDSMLGRGFSSVIVTARGEPGALPPNAEFVAMDMLDDGSVKRGCQRIAEKMPAMDAIFMVAGMAGSKGPWNEASADEMATVYRCNVIGPMLVAQHLMPNLEKGSDKLLVHVSTSFASIGDNSNGTSAPYRCSKAALNMWTKSLAVELQNRVKVLAYNPGVVVTELLGDFFQVSKEKLEEMGRAQNWKMPEQAGEDLCNVCLDEKRESGHFYSFDGSEIEW